MEGLGFKRPIDPVLCKFHFHLIQQIFIKHFYYMQDTEHCIGYKEQAIVPLFEIFILIKNRVGLINI